MRTFILVWTLVLFIPLFGAFVAFINLVDPFPFNRLKLRHRICDFVSALMLTATPFILGNYY